MATLILGTIGRVFAGPIGGLIGTVAGGVIDRAVLGSGTGREVGRISNLAVQSAAYGEPIPVITGVMRAAGNLLWTSGIKESSARSGGGKRGGPATTTFSYSASFAVGLTAREIVGVGRIWADGTLIRDAAGVFVAPVTMRVHRGNEGQAADPLIAAFEGVGGAPAYRGIAYVVFEDLPLGDFGNRIPNLTFEIVADDGGVEDAGRAIATLTKVEGSAIVSVDGVFPAFAGYFAGQSGSIAEAIAPLVAVAGGAITSRGGLSVRGSGGVPVLIAKADGEARAAGDNRALARVRRLGDESRVGAVEVTFYDSSRDFQPGLQRARRDMAGGIDHQAIASAMSPDQAKTVAVAMLARNNAARLRANLRLSWRHLALQPGDLVRLSDDDTVWRVRELQFANFVIDLDLERVETMAAVPASGDGGRALRFANVAAGPTTFHVLDLPPLPGDVSALPRLWVAAAGAAPGWRRASIDVSGDDGASYAPVGIAGRGAILGIATTPLRNGSPAGWDRFAAVDVELLADAMWLEGRSEAAVLAGSNLALVGDEIIQFAQAEALAPRRFRLSGLLRGRRGTEATTAGHIAGERFVMLDPAMLVAFDPPLEAVDREFRIRAGGVGDAMTAGVDVIARGRALCPLSPARLTLRVTAGDVQARWLRRSRAGFGWSDFVDAPLAEVNESYRVDVAIDGRPARSVTVGEAEYSYAAADRLADGGGSRVTITVSQLSAVVGPGVAAIAAIDL